MGSGAETEQLYRTYGPMVLRRAERILGQKEAARDVMQEVFISVLQNGHAFRGEASPSTWLYKMTTNLCLNRIRDSTARAKKLEEAHGPEFTETAVPGDSDARIALQRAFAKLPEELCQVGVYYYLDQMGHEEIAQILGVSRRTAGNRVEEFRTRAAQLLESGAAA